MARTKKGKKGPGYNYHGKRAGNESGVAVPCRYTKKRTAKKERQIGKREAKQ